mmetsp:Transcript_21343/g.47414  ORF Transcript_21343/g.47414 Transcript_21343/m.47414 type:complete len:224 (-) Transcript_21343:713-1384(-)
MVKSTLSRSSTLIVVKASVPISNVFMVNTLSAKSSFDTPILKTSESIARWLKGATADLYTSQEEFVNCWKHRQLPERKSHMPRLEQSAYSGYILSVSCSPTVQKTTSKRLRRPIWSVEQEKADRGGLPSLVKIESSKGNVGNFCSSIVYVRSCTVGVSSWHDTVWILRRPSMAALQAAAVNTEASVEKVKDWPLNWKRNCPSIWFFVKSLSELMVIVIVRKAV